MKIQTKILDSRLGTLWPMPSYTTVGSAGIDLRACIDQPLVLSPGKQMLVSTGISIYIADPNWAAIVLPRSGMGSKGLVLANTIGLIDSDYQGVLQIVLWNRGSNADGEYMLISPGDRVAQLVFIPVQQVDLQVVQEFDNESKRGGGGYGHTGKN